MERIYCILNAIKPGFDYRNNKEYIDSGWLDSMDIINLITRLEKEFDIEIDGLDVIPDNFENAIKIADILRKYGADIREIKEP